MNFCKNPENGNISNLYDKPVFLNAFRSGILLFLHFLSVGAVSQTLNLDSLLTPEEHKWLNQNRNSIRYAPNPFWAPVDFIEDGVHKGIVADFIRIFEDKLGITLQRVYPGNWSELLEGLKNEDVDFIGGIHYNEERESFLRFSDPFLQVPLGILVRDNLRGDLAAADISGMKLATVKGYAVIPYLKERYPGISVTEAPDELSALLETSLGRSDGTVTDFMTASYLVEKWGISNMQFGTELGFHWDLRFACRDEMPEFDSIINKVLSTISEAEKKAIVNRWSGMKMGPDFRFIIKYRKYIVGLILMGIFLFAVIVIFNRILVSRVRHRTKELKKAWDTARESERKFRTLFEKHSAIKLIIDPDSGFIVNANESACRFYGWPLDELKSMRISQINLLSPEQIKQEMERARHSSDFRAEFRHRKADGSVVDVEVYSNKMVIEGKEMLHSIIYEITERKQAEQIILKRLKMEQMLARISEAAVGDSDIPGLLEYILKEAGMATAVGRAYIFEYRAKTDTFDNTHDWCDEGIVSLKEHFRGIPSSEVKWWLEMINAEKIVSCKNVDDIENGDARRWLQEQGILSILIVPMYLKGRLSGFVGFDECIQRRDWPREDVDILQSVAHIITSLIERREAGSELLIRTRAIESSLTPISLTSLEGYFLYVNPAFIRVWGFSNTEDVLKRNPASFWKTEEEAVVLYNRLMEQGYFQGEITARKADGSFFEVEVNAGIIRDVEEKPVSVVASFADITERKRWEEGLVVAKEKAEQSDRLKSAFLANLSHEIRTPMNGILGFLNILKEIDLPPEEQAEYFNLLKESGLRLLDTVSDIIEMSRIESGELLLHEEKFKPALIFSYLLEFFKPQAKEKSLELNWIKNQECDHVSMIADRLKLESVLSNLIRNAIKFTSRGRVDFGCINHGDNITFFVRDTGPGIPRKFHEQVFERFAQVDSGYSRQNEGSGLGLSIAKAYAEKMGGTIILESEEGKGSNFIVRLPR
jgi:PAS domain S-box-containing protein